MPRRPRFNLPELPQHIVQRGNNRQVTFVADVDYSFYRECKRQDIPGSGEQLTLLGEIK